VKNSYILDKYDYFVLMSVKLSLIQPNFIIILFYTFPNFNKFVLTVYTHLVNLYMSPDDDSLWLKREKGAHSNIVG
jgi:hypothetical protein